MDAKLWGEEYNRHNPPKKVSNNHVMNLVNQRQLCSFNGHFPGQPG